ncbi:MAG: acetyl/propionyl/methylcrotonyl-CoA carboxylase subunit alpha [Burkholderiaceae bacterium]
MFEKILIANRGEIACRIIRSARALGIATVAVYSEADAGAQHVLMADEAVLIGPPAVARSYLDAQRILDAARQTGAQAIHPGYGFLSENPAFVDAVQAAGLVFIGPSADSIRAMGLKDEAKRRMQAAGVAVVPGYHGAAQDVDTLAAEAARIGFPVLIKARAGGGGKGMRRVERAEDFAAALAGAQREGQSSFGDPACLIEKYVTSPRHIEIQVFGDQQGNVVYLFERDCSLQRRHQKVIEEAPAPGMTPAMRSAMGEAAVRAARAIDYVGAGTIEFIVDGSDGLREDRFYFMEMNTRLQVEHPVTEAITGQDLVAWQLRVAAGEPLPMQQHELAIDGWAFEARLYAENVDKGFLPATGQLTHLRFPAAVRIDSGVVQGDRITPYYDPMIAKVIVHGPTRAAALNQLAWALGQTEVSGSVTNLAFLERLCRHPGFARGEVDTGLIARDLGWLTEKPALAPMALPVAALAVHGLLVAATDDPPADPWQQADGWSLWAPHRQQVRFVHEGELVQAQVSTLAAGRHEVRIGDGPGVTLRVRFLPDGGWRVDDGQGQQTVRVLMTRETVTLFIGERVLVIGRVDPLAVSTDEATATDQLVSPMPGLIKMVAAGAGDAVSKGQVLVVLEAMKMEHSLTASRDGEIAEVMVGVGTQVEEGHVVLALKPLPETK